LSDGLNVFDLRKWYLGREFEPLSDLPCATIADLRGALISIAQKSSLSPQQKMRLAGYAVLGRYIEDEIPRTTIYRLRSELRQAGIFVDPTQIERLEVPVGRYLQTLSSAWAA
jgi:hypothetical protein